MISNFEEYVNLETKALASETVQKFMEGKTPKKVIVIEGRLVNIVI